MWAVGYAGRLPAVRLPSPLLLGLLLLCLVGCGVALGRFAGCGWQQGAVAGALAGLLNTRVLGGILAGGRPSSGVPSAAIWLPGSVLLAALLSAAGAAAFVPGGARPREWSGALVKVATGAALLLLAVGGVVTSAGAGLAVLDWPRTFGYNMFLYPLSRMTGGIYYEHAHRLFGALVGLTTLVMAVQLQWIESRRAVRALAWAIVAAVVAQGIVGGLRVTGTSLALAMAHGVLAHIVLAGLVALSAFTSVAWRAAPARAASNAAFADRLLGLLLLLLLAGQLVLGAAQRHFDALLLVHAVFGVGLVAPLAVHVGFRAWGMHGDRPLLRGLGLALILAVGTQVVLGLSAWAAKGQGGTAPAIAIATLHQWFGAVLLGLAVLLFVWNWRLVGPPAGDEVAVGPRRDSAYT